MTTKYSQLVKLIEAELIRQEQYRDQEGYRHNYDKAVHIAVAIDRQFRLSDKPMKN